jgi:hypothetical protein
MMGTSDPSNAATFNWFQEAWDIKMQGAFILRTNFGDGDEQSWEVNADWDSDAGPTVGGPGPDFTGGGAGVPAISYSTTITGISMVLTTTPGSGYEMTDVPIRIQVSLAEMKYNSEISDAVIAGSSETVAGLSYWCGFRVHAKWELVGGPYYNVEDDPLTVIGVPTPGSDWDTLYDNAAEDFREVTTELSPAFGSTDTNTAHLRQTLVLTDEDGNPVTDFNVTSFTVKARSMYGPRSDL